MSDLAPLKQLPEVLARADDLPSLPAVAMRVLELCRDENTTLDDLADCISHDPALAARLLRFSNSTLYNLGQEVTTLQRATLVLGMKTVQLTSLSFSLAGAIPKESREEDAFDLQVFWNRALACSVAGRTFAGLCGSLAEDEAFLCGLLGEIGQVVMAHSLPEQYGTVLSVANGSWPTPELETQLLGFHLGDVGEALLASWNLPPIICRTVGAMHEPKGEPMEAEPELTTLVEVMRIANLTVELLTTERKGEALAKIEDAAQEQFGLHPDVVYQYITSLESGIREASEMLNMELPTGKPHEEILEEARVQMRELSVCGLMQGRGEEPADCPELAHRKEIPLDLERFDACTGLPGHDAVEAFLQAEGVARLAKVVSRPLGVLMVRLEHSAGTDAQLETTARVLEPLVRKGDLLGFVGDHTFQVTMIHTSPKGMAALAKRLSEALTELTGDGESWSIGGACLGMFEHMQDLDVLSNEARRCLVRAGTSIGERIRLRPMVTRPRG